jgi:hypothetical protein
MRRGMNLAAASRSDVADPPCMCPRILLQELREAGQTVSRSPSPCQEQPKAEFEEKRG